MQKGAHQEGKNMICYHHQHAGAPVAGAEALKVEDPIDTMIDLHIVQNDIVARSRHAMDHIAIGNDMLRYPLSINEDAADPLVTVLLSIRGLEDRGRGLVVRTIGADHVIFPSHLLLGNTSLLPVRIIARKKHHHFPLHAGMVPLSLATYHQG